MSLILFAPPRPPWTPRRLPGLKVWAAANFGVTFAAVASADFRAAQSEYLTVADSASFSGADVGWWTCGWLRINALGTNRGVWSKYGAASADQEFTVFHSSANQMQFFVRGGTTTTGVTNTPTLPANTWWFVCCWHDPTLNTINIRVNHGTPTSAAHSVGTRDGTAPFEIGRDFASRYWDGRIDHVAYGKTPADIGLVIDDISSRFYGGGTGLPYNDITSTEKTDWGLIELWNLDEISDGSGAVNRVGSHAGTVLTDTNTTPSGAGIVPTTRIASITDRSPLVNHLIQSTVAVQPRLGSNIFGSLPGIRFVSGAWLGLTSAVVLTGDFTLDIVAMMGDFTGTYAGHVSGTGSIVQTDADTLTIMNDAGTALAINHTAYDSGVHEVTLVRSGSTITRYLDGQPDGTGTLSGTITLDRIGVQGASTLPLTADVASLVLYDRAYLYG